MWSTKSSQPIKSSKLGIGYEVIITLLSLISASGMIFSQVLYENLPDYVSNRQNYRERHQPKLYYIQAQPEKIFSENSLRFNTALLAYKAIPRNTFFIQLLIKSNKWSLYTEPWIVNEYYGYDILGADFTQLGLKGRYLQSFLKYKGNSFNFKLGRFRQRWGQSHSNSLIFSLHSLPFDQTRLEFDLGSWKFDLFGGSFSSELINDLTKINRHVAGHRIRRSFFNEKLLIEGGEVIVYTGENRSWDIQYLSPFSLYYVDMFNPTNYLREDGKTWDNENALMFFSVRWIQTKAMSIFGELLLDDFQLDDTGVQNKLGLKLGVDGSAVILDLPITYEMEYTRLDSWTYLNRGQLTNFENLGHTVGYSFGPDNQNIRVQLDGWLQKKLLLDFEYTYIEKGINTLQSVPDDSNNLNTTEDSFPRPPVHTYNLAKLSLSWWMKYGRIEIGWSNVPFSNTIAYDGSPDINGSVYLKLQGHYTFQGF